MIKWFFLTFIAALATVMVCASLGSDTGLVSKAFAIAAVSTFTAALIAMWLGAYVYRFKAAGYYIYGHAGVMLATGIGFIGIGMHGIVTGTCNHLVSSSGTGFLTRIASWFIENNCCFSLSVFLIAFGCFMLWPSVKLMWNLTVRSMCDGI